METLLRFNDLACVNDADSGPMGAGLALLSRAGFSTARGFVITPKVFDEFLKREELAASFPGDGEKEPDWDGIADIFNRTRIIWSHEIDLITAFRELSGPISLMTTSRLGADTSPSYASGEETFLLGVKSCWLDWIRSGGDVKETDTMPAVLVREILEAEASVELSKRKDGIRARAVFGLPEGLDDPSVSSDIYEFDPSDELTRIEQREQEWQYIMKAGGPVRVELAEDFRSEEKASGKMLSSLKDIMGAMWANHDLDRCTVCFVEAKPLIYSAGLTSVSRTFETALPSREDSLSLMMPAEEEVEEKVAPRMPVVATKLYVHVADDAVLSDISDSYIEGILIDPRFLEGAENWVGGMVSLVTEAKRQFNTTRFIMQMTESLARSPETLVELTGELAEHEVELALLLPGIRSSEEFERAVRSLRGAWEEGCPKLWSRVMYPSNIFFMDVLARHSDMLALDLDALARFMIGATDEEEWLNFSVPSFRRALTEIFEHSRAFRTGTVVISPDLVSTPGLLELLVRQGTEILCVGAEDLGTVGRIVASVEKRMLIEQGSG